jgi:ribosomal protein L30/L7E
MPWLKRPSRPERTPALLLGIRPIAVVEIVAMLGLALALDRFLFNGTRFMELAPHPFWAVVLLTAAQYGTREALLATALSTAALLTGNLPEQGFSEDRSAWLLRISSTPVLWIIAGVVIGEIRERHKRKTEALGGELASVREQARTFAEAYERLDTTKRELEARIAGQVQTVRAMHRASRAIERQGTSEVLVGVATLVQTVLNPVKFSLFLVNGPRLETAASYGWHEEDRYASEFDSASPLFQAIISRSEFLTAVNHEQEMILGEEGVLAGPIISEETDRVLGMLKIEDIAFVDLTPTNVQNFQVICDWIGTAYDNALRHERRAAEKALEVQTVRAMHRASRAIERQGTSEVLVGVATLVQTVLNPVKFSLFLVNGPRLETAASYGWHEEDRYASEFDSASPLFQAIISRSEFLTAVNHEQEMILGEEGVLAGPIISEETDRVLGMLKIEDIAFVHLTPTNVQNFQVICDWIGTAYDNALRREFRAGERTVGSQVLGQPS